MKQAAVTVIFLILIAACFFIPQAGSSPGVHEALFYDKLADGMVQCRLCPRQCFIPSGKRGFCGVRENRSGKLCALTFSRPVAIHIDPIEKKPLFHFYPGTKAFSLATVGCNLRCKFCQNWEISQARPEDVQAATIEPQELVRRAIDSGCPSIAYTYTEPTVYFEYMLETAKLARAAGLKNVIHSAGYINEAPLRELCRYLDGANIDLKGFTEDYYARMSEGSLEPVLRTLKILKESGVELELTTLIVPGFNDDPAVIKKMCIWIRDNLGEETPLHFSRFFPLYKLAALNPTPPEVLEKAREVALAAGLKYVYVGNLAGNLAENTYCPACGKLLVKRAGYFVSEEHIKDGKCSYCGKKISGIWN